MPEIKFSLNIKIFQKIRREIEACQDIIDAFEIVCNNLTAQLSELAAISGDSVMSQEPEYLVELQTYKTDLHDVRERYGIRW